MKTLSDFKSVHKILVQGLYSCLVNKILFWVFACTFGANKNNNIWHFFKKGLPVKNHATSVSSVPW